MKRPPRPLKTQVSVRASTHARLREAAQKQGEQMATLLDGLIVAWLDEHDKRTN